MQLTRKRQQVLHGHVEIPDADFPLFQHGVQRRLRGGGHPRQHGVQGLGIGIGVNLVSLPEFAHQLAQFQLQRTHVIPRMEHRACRGYRRYRRVRLPFPQFEADECRTGPLDAVDNGQADLGGSKMIVIGQVGEFLAFRVHDVEHRDDDNGDGKDHRQQQVGTQADVANLDFGSRRHQGSPPCGACLRSRRSSRANSSCSAGR